MNWQIKIKCKRTHLVSKLVTNIKYKISDTKLKTRKAGKRCTKSVNMDKHGLLGIQKWDQVPWRSEHPLSTGHTRRESKVLNKEMLGVNPVILGKFDSISTEKETQHFTQWSTVIANKVVITTIKFAERWNQARLLIALWQ